MTMATAVRRLGPCRGPSAESARWGLNLILRTIHPYTGDVKLQKGHTHGPRSPALSQRPFLPPVSRVALWATSEVPLEDVHWRENWAERLET